MFFLIMSTQLVSIVPAERREACLDLLEKVNCCGNTLLTMTTKAYFELCKDDNAMRFVWQLSDYDYDKRQDYCLTLALCLQRSKALPLEIQLMIMRAAQESMPDRSFYTDTPASPLYTFVHEHDQSMEHIAMAIMRSRLEYEEQEHINCAIKVLFTFMPKKDKDNFVRCLCSNLKDNGGFWDRRMSEGRRLMYISVLMTILNRIAPDNIDFYIAVLTTGSTETHACLEPFVRGLAQKGTSPLCRLICSQ
jgi:hypothetical protein